MRLKNLITTLLISVVLVNIVNAYEISTLPAQEFNLTDGECIHRVLNVTFVYTNKTESLLVYPKINLPYFQNNISPPWFVVNLNSTIMSQKFPIKYDICVPENYEAGIYEGFLSLYVTNAINGSIISDYNRLPLTITIPKFENITTTSLNITTYSNASGTFCINITNNGNIEKIFNVSLMGSKIGSFDYPKQKIVRVGKQKLCVAYKVNPNITGINTLTIRLKNQQNVYSSQIIFNVTDNIKPQINHVYFPDTIYPHKGFTLRVNVTDNIGIRNITANVCGQTKKLFENEQRLYENDFVINRSGNCSIGILAADINGLRSQKIIPINVKYLSILDITNPIHTYKIKVGKNYTVKLWHLDKPREVKISLNKTYIKQIINGTPQTVKWNPTLKLIYDGGSIKLIKGSKYTLLTRTANLLVPCNQKGNYTIVMRYTFPEDIAKNNTITQYIFGECSDYTVSPPFVGNILGIDVKCYPQDTGIYQTSKYICTVSYPIDTDINGTKIIFPREVYDSMKQSYEMKIKVKEDKIKHEKTIIKWTWIFIGLIMVGIGTYYVINKLVVV